MCKLHSVEINCSVHATEDIKKVRKAFLFIVPENLREKITIEETPVVGHAKNPIILLEAKVTSKKRVEKIVEHLAQEISDFEKEFLTEEFDDRVGENNRLFIRFNKQDAYNELLTIDRSDNSIKVIIKFIIYKEQPGLLRKTITTYGLIKKEQTDEALL
jgi:hypothetical protein